MVLKNYGSISITVPRKSKQSDYLNSNVEENNNNDEGNRENSSLKLFGFSRTSVYFSFYLVLYLLFLSFGALMFSFMEQPTEIEWKLRLNTAVGNFLRKYPNVPDQALEDLITEVVSASNRGVSAIGNATGESNWTFGQSFFFTSTVVTTIGYGHVTPLSRTGKFFCMIYATVGIPLTMVLLSALVSRLLIPTVWLLQWLNARLGHLYQPFKIRLFHLFIMVMILLILFVLIPAGIFAEIEPDWDYMDSLYYCFISLTTIGLGDYIPGDSPHQPYRPLYKIATTGFLYMGMTFLMLTLAVFYDIPQLNLGFLFNSDSLENSEKKPLAGSGLIMQYGGANNTSSILPDKNEENPHKKVVKVRSRRNDDDSPSSDETNNKELMRS